jgi:hypothetical protein
MWTNVPEERIISIFKAENQPSIWTTRPYVPDDGNIITTAVKTSDLTYWRDREEAAVPYFKFWFLWIATMDSKKLGLPTI